MVKKRILITGGSGFIGRNVIEQLGYEYNFVAPSHKELDILNFNKVEEFFKKNRDFDIVIHTAICGGNRRVPDSANILNLNLRMFFNIVRCKKYWNKIIYLGSGIEFGKEEPIKLIREADFDKRIPQDNFGFYKYICAKYIENSRSILNLRLFGVWGKYEDYSIRFISNAICKVIFGLPITINQNVFYDYIHVNDFIKILNYFINDDFKFSNYNVGTGNPIDLKTIANKILSIANSGSGIKISKAGLANEYTCDNKRLISEIGHFEFSDFENELVKLFNWYTGRKSRLSKKLLLNDYFN